MKKAPETSSRLQRWQLVLGQSKPPSQESTEPEHPSEKPELLPKQQKPSEANPLPERLQKIEQTLDTLYGSEKRKAGLSESAPYAVRWLADVREYFPKPVARMLQQDAWERFEWKTLLREPEFLESLEPDVSLVPLLVSLKSLLPARTRQTAREVVQRVIDDLRQRWELPLQQALRGGLSRQQNPNPQRLSEINWNRTILKNLKHYQPAYKTIIPEQLVGWKNQQKQHYHVILCVDQSASMQRSVVHAGVLGAVLAGIPSLTTRLILFDTQVVDVTDQLSDPVELLFGVQMGGGTHITKALRYARTQVREPSRTILFLISDLFEGENSLPLLEEMQALLDSGVLPVVLLALDDKGGTPSHQVYLAQSLTKMGIAVLSCTPEAFPPLFTDVLRQRSRRQ